MGGGGCSRKQVVKAEPCSKHSDSIEQCKNKGDGNSAGGVGGGGEEQEA